MPVLRTFHKSFTPIEDFEEICSTELIYPSLDSEFESNEFEENPQEKEMETSSQLKHFPFFSWNKWFSFLPLRIKRN